MRVFNAGIKAENLASQAACAKLGVLNTGWVAVIQKRACFRFPDFTPQLLSGVTIILRNQNLAFIRFQLFLQFHEMCLK